MAGATQEFGGRWTEEKLERIARYLQAYTTALKNQRFRRIYIDAFAGTGYRATKRRGETVRGFFPLPRMTELAKGSARRALDVQPPFDQYVFIEADPGRFRELEKLSDEVPQLRDRMQFRNEEANSAIVDICRNTNWRDTRAVLFLDPYGKQVDWTTIEEVGRVQHIDLWYLFPVGVVQRLLRRKGGISTGRGAGLDRLLGDSGWRAQFYRSQPTLFEGVAQQAEVADLQLIERYVRRRLERLFPGGVAERALELRNSKNSCMFLLFFACGNPNPRAHRLALRIAQHLLKE